MYGHSVSSVRDHFGSNEPDIMAPHMFGNQMSAAEALASIKQVEPLSSAAGRVNTGGLERSQAGNSGVFGDGSSPLMEPSDEA